MAIKKTFIAKAVERKLITILVQDISQITIFDDKYNEITTVTMVGRCQDL